VYRAVKAENHNGEVDAEEAMMLSPVLLVQTMSNFRGILFSYK